MQERPKEQAPFIEVGEAVPKSTDVTVRASDFSQRLEYILETAPLIMESEVEPTKEEAPSMPEPVCIQFYEDKAEIYTIHKRFNLVVYPSSTVLVGALPGRSREIPFLQATSAFRPKKMRHYSLQVTGLYKQERGIAMVLRTKLLEIQWTSLQEWAIQNALRV